MFAPVTWSCGPVPAALPPAPCTSAYFAPENASASNSANGPPHVVSTPILIALPLPAPVLAVVAVLVGVAFEPLFLLLDPQPARARTATAAMATHLRLDI